MVLLCEGCNHIFDSLAGMLIDSYSGGICNQLFIQTIRKEIKVFFN